MTEIPLHELPFWDKITIIAAIIYIISFMIRWISLTVFYMPHDDEGYLFLLRPSKAKTKTDFWIAWGLMFTPFSITLLFILEWIVEMVSMYDDLEDNNQQL